jgi:hypothetical protein
MGVSLTAPGTVGGGTIRNTLVAALVVVAALLYLYGPAAAPAVHDAALAKCNEHASGNFRSFRLSWVVGWHPHWTCWDARKPQEPEVSFGWWVNPF